MSYSNGNRKERQALVLSGSGAGSTAAYEIGVMKALQQGCAHLGDVPVDADIYTGSAFGAFNAAIMASQIGGDAAGTLKYLEAAWLEGMCSTRQSCGNNVYRVRGNPLPFLNLKCYMPAPWQPFVDFAQDTAFLTVNLAKRLQYFLGPNGPGSLTERVLSIPSMTPFFNVQPFKDQLKQHIDLARIRNSDKELVVMASDWAKGMPRAFTKPELTDELGHDIIQASCTFLLAFPFVEIEGRPYGGAPGSMATPLKPAIDLFAGRQEPLTIHLVFLQPTMDQVPIDKMSSALSGLGRSFSMNEVVNIHSEVEYQLPAAAARADAAERQRRADGDRWPITIHKYRPKQGINWFEFANFQRSLAEQHIAAGYQDTLQHDCQVEGCVIAGSACGADQRKAAVA